MAKSNKTRATTPAKTDETDTQELSHEQVELSKQESDASVESAAKVDEPQAQDQAPTQAPKAQETASTDDGAKAGDEQALKSEAVTEVPPTTDTPQAVEVTPEDQGNYLNLPEALRDANASQERIHTPTGTRIRPAMNPFMRMEEEKKARAVKSNVPDATEMKERVKKELNILDLSADFVLLSVMHKLDYYVQEMAPNTPVSEAMMSRLQMELANCFFEALAAKPDVAILTLGIIECYFKAYAHHALSRTHVFRAMDTIRLEQQRLLAFQSLLHLFVELGSPQGRTRKEIARNIQISKIADALIDNSDAQVRLIEFVS